MDMGLLNYLVRMTQLFSELFLTQQTRFRHWDVIDLIENHRRVIYKSKLSNYITLHISTIIFKVDLVTPASLWRHKDAHDRHNHA